MDTLQEEPKNEGVRQVVYDLVARFEEFGAFSDRMRHAILNLAEWVLSHKAGEVHIDNSNADEVLAMSVYGVRQDYRDLTAEEYYELEEWADFLGDVFDTYSFKWNRPQRGRPSKRRNDYWFFERFPSEFPDTLPDWSSVPCIVSEDSEQAQS
jgi:hypothetical protein